jgi:hypothetical protein
MSSRAFIILRGHGMVSEKEMSMLTERAANFRDEITVKAKNFIQKLSKSLQTSLMVDITGFKSGWIKLANIIPPEGS